ncbi:acyl carrier protein [soil metagenome]
MEKNELLTAVQEVAAEVLGVEADAVVPTANFKDDLEADSLDLVELVMALEDRLDITVPEEDLEGVATVDDALNMLSAKLGAKA